MHLTNYPSICPSIHLSSLIIPLGDEEGEQEGVSRRNSRSHLLTQPYAKIHSFARIQSPPPLLPPHSPRTPPAVHNSRPPPPLPPTSPFTTRRSPNQHTAGALNAPNGFAPTGFAPSGQSAPNGPNGPNGRNSQIGQIGQMAQINQNGQNGRNLPNGLSALTGINALSTFDAQRQEAQNDSRVPRARLGPFSERPTRPTEGATGLRGSVSVAAFSTTFARSAGECPVQNKCTIYVCKFMYIYL